MSRDFRNVNWSLKGTGERIETWEKVSIAVLMDIREELQTLNNLLRCPNFTNMPFTLKEIQKNTTKPRKRKKEPNK